jgi:D-alanyl-D-alanine carboxypeptidase (penicillin-binding protein 5/6)
MTLLLVMEAIDAGQIKLQDIVSASAHAASMGGSQIYLKEGEQMSVEDLLKSVIIASANDAALALAEHIAGSETAFVEMMNEKAKQLGLKNTNFENTNGLDDTVQNHVTSARDIAIMSRELIKHKKITEYSSIWMDSIRGGEFGLTNTNRLVRFYKGATGLKTGSTSKAKFCITATAERDGLSLICVIMAAPTRDLRNAAAASLLDWGFANYAVYKNEPEEIDPPRVLGGVKSKCALEYGEFSCVVKKSDLSNVTFETELEETLAAPIKKGERVGRVVYKLGETELGESPILASEDVAKIDFWGLMLKILSKMAIA